MSRRKQTKPRHFDTEVDGDADQRDGESIPLVDEDMAVSLSPCLNDFTPTMMMSSRASSVQAECDELYQSEHDYVSALKEAEDSSRLTGEEEGEGEGEEDDGDMEGEDAEAMYDYFMSRQSGIDADTGSVSAETMAADLKDCTNVKLKTIENTKVAVAQFAENNLAPADYLMLQSTLYNLQQQQLFQLQLLQQIQQQLVSGVSPTMIANLRRLTSHPASTHPVPMAIPPLLPMSNVMSVMSSSCAPLTSVTGALSSYNDRESKYTMAHTSSTSLSMSMSPLKMLSSLKTPSAITTPTADLLPLPQTSAVTSGSDSSQFGKVKSPNVTVSGTVLPREQYAADDPFFKHKCRFCHKVFGSDSALQIHIRSHTGERPYKCNICANRFSTKGNLKVHFARHKASYPDVKMNATMFPEHLDRPAKLAPSGVSSASSLPVVSPLAANHTPAFSHMTLGAKEKMAEDVDEASCRPSQHGDSASQLGEAVHSNEASRTSFMDEQSVRPSSAMSLSRNETPVPANTCSPALSSRSSTSSPAMTPSASCQSLPMACLSSMVPPMPQPLMSSVAPTMPPFGFEPLPFYSSPSQSILPSSKEDPMEQFMEIQKSETSKLEQLVKNIESKLTDPNQCAICHRILSCKSALLMHYRTHTGERPFKCKICGRAFTTKGNLKTHMGVHRAKPPVRMMHQCPVCHKQFTNALVLQQHVRMHTGELPKDFALHGDMLAASAAMNYMAPFPGFPFLPLPPGLPQHPMGAAGELDLRKPKMEGHHEDRERAEEEAKDDYMTPGKRRASEDESNREAWSAEGSVNEDSNEADIAAYKRAKLDDEVKSAVSESDRESEMREKDGESAKEGETEDDASASGLMPPARRPSSVPHASTPPALVPLSQVLSANKPEMMYPRYSHPPLIPMSYSTSLMAMEDRIRSIDMTAPHFLSMGHPLEGMENIIRRAETHMTASSHHHVPRSENHSPAAMTPMPRPPSSGDRRSPTEDSATAASPSMAMSPGDSGSNHMERNGGSEHGYVGSATQSFLDETTCNVCFKTFACRSALDIHYRSHANDRPFKCEACDRSFSTYGNMKQHLLTHKIRDLPTDAFDGQTKTSAMDALATSTPLKSTEPTMSRPEDVSLPTHKSDLALPRLESMKTPPETDAEKKHKISPPSTSSDNSQSPFVRRPNLKHMCMVCQKPFSSASALQIHMRTHTGDKPFKCTVCGKAFTTKGNLKVHMGTHMWNNSPSRRGRRMSIDPRPSLTPTSSPKDAEFFSSFAHHPPPPDMYPFPFPPSFPNGFMSPKMNEISVIQGLNGGMNPMMPLPPTTEAMLGHFPASFAENMLRSQFAVIASSQQHLRAAAEEHPLKASDSTRKPPDLSMNGTDGGDKQTNGASGELDLSIRKSESSTPSSISSSLEQHSMDAAHNATWIWKTTCHLCSKVCSSASALEMHMKGHLQAHNDELTSKPLVA